MIVQVKTFKFKPMLTAIIIDGKPWFIVNDIADYIGVSSTYINANVPQEYLYQLYGREHISKIKKIDSCVYRLNLIDKDGIFSIGRFFTKRVISHLTNPLVSFINIQVIPQSKHLYQIELKRRSSQKKKALEPKTEQPDLFQEQRIIEMENQVSGLVKTIGDMSEKMELQETKINFLLDELGIVYKDRTEEQINSLVKTLGLSVEQAKQLIKMAEQTKSAGVGSNGSFR